MKEKNSILIRKYKKEDMNCLVNILRQNTPHYFADEETADFIEYLNKFIEFYFVIEFNGKIVGSGGINLSEDQNNGKISWDIINPDFQHKGLGKKLLIYRIQYILTVLGIKQITVRTSQLAYKFYEKNNFKTVNIERNYWAVGYDLYEMQYYQQTL